MTRLATRPPWVARKGYPWLGVWMANRVISGRRRLVPRTSNEVLRTEIEVHRTEIEVRWRESTFQHAAHRMLAVCSLPGQHERGVPGECTRGGYPGAGTRVLYTAAASSSTRLHLVLDSSRLHLDSSRLHLDSSKLVLILIIY